MKYEEHNDHLLNHNIIISHRFHLQYKNKIDFTIL